MSGGWCHRSLLLAIAAHCIACDGFEPGALTLETPDDVVADGASVHDITLCIEATHPASLRVTLVASGGAWLLPWDPAQPEQTVVGLDAESRCATERWIAPDIDRPVRLWALVGDEPLASADVRVQPAPIAGVELIPSSPFLADEGPSVVNLSARAVVIAAAMSSGEPRPTIGSRVMLSVESDPPGAAAVDDGVIQFGVTESRVLYAADGTRRATVTVRDRLGQTVLGTLTLQPAVQPAEP